MGNGEEIHPGTEPVFRYAAFISYRHCEMDREWARWLHRALETYRVPRRLAKERGLPARIGRVFRDEEELEASSDLSTSIEQALVASHFLIVVCSPRTPASRWVEQEVNRFREMGRGDRILTLLIEGEPGESFPRSLREIRRSTVSADGVDSSELMEIEPLAADARPSHPKAAGHALRPGHRIGRMGRGLVRLRLLAPILGVRFDDLRQREQERRTRRVAMFGVILAILTCAMGLTAVEAVRQRNAALAANVEKDLQRTIAESQRAKAVEKTGEAERNLREADIQRDAANTRTAESLLAQGDALGRAGHWPDAFERYEEARERLAKLGLSTLQADFASWDAYRHTSPALLTMRLDRPRGLFTRDGRYVMIASGKTLQQRYAATGQFERMCSQHAADIIAIAISADGRLALSGGEDKQIKVWDIQHHRELFSLADDAPVTDLTVSDNGAIAASSNKKHVVKLWDTVSGKLLYEPSRFDSDVYVTLTGDGTQMLIGRGSRVSLWDVVARKNASKFEATTVGLLFNSTISPDGVLAAAGDWATRVCVWNVLSGKRLAVMDGHRNGVHCIAFSPDRRFLATGSFDSTVRLWSMETFEEIRVYSGHAAAIISLAFSRDGRFLLSGSADGSLKIWSTEAVPAVRGAYGHDAPVNAVAVSPDGRLAVSGDYNRVRLWDVATGRQLWAEDLQVGTSAAAFTPNGRTIVTAGASIDGSSCRLFDISDDGNITRRDVSADEVETANAVAVFPDSHFALIGGGKGKIQRIDLTTAHAVGAAFPPAKHSIFALDLSPDGKMLAITDGPLADIRDAVTGKVLHDLGAGGSSSWRTWMAWLPSGGWIFGGGSGAELHTWNALSGGPENSVDTGAGRVDALAVSPDGNVAITAHPQQSLRLWDVQHGLLLRSMPIAADSVRRLDWAAHAPIVAAAEDQHVDFIDFGHLERFRPLRERASKAAAAIARWNIDNAAVMTMGEWYAHLGIWDRAVACMKRTLDHGGLVPPAMLARCYWQNGQPDLAVEQFEKALAAVRSRTDRTATTRSNNDDDAGNAIYLALCLSAARREAETARGDITLLRTLPGHEAPIHSLAISPDGRSALTGSMDGLVKWWDLSTGQAVRTFAAHHGVVRDLAFVPAAAKFPGVPGGTFAVTAGGDHTVRLWRLDTSSEVTKWEENEEVRAVAVSPHGETLAAAGTERLRVWDLRLGPTPLGERTPRTLIGHKGSSISCLAFSPDSRRLVSGFWDGVEEVWDVGQGVSQKSRRVHYSSVRCVVFSSDGRFILSAGKDSNVGLWDLNNDDAARGASRLFSGQRAPVTNAQFCPDGKTAVSVSDNGSAIIWDLATGKPIRRTHPGAHLAAVAVAPDGKTFFTAGFDLAVKEWKLNTRAMPSPATAPSMQPATMRGSK